MGTSPSPTFTRWLDTEVNTERASKTGDKISVSTNLTGAKIMAIMPLPKELRQVFEIGATRQAWVTYAHHTTDIAGSDNLVTNAGESNEKKYPVFQVRPYPGNEDFIEIIMLKR